MRAWQLLACIALALFAVSAAFSLGGPYHEASDDMEVAASGHHESHSSGFEEDGGSKHGEDHHAEVKSYIEVK